MSIKDPVWLSAHVFYSGDLHLLLQKMLLPFLHELKQLNLMEGSFFIRYFEGGKHIRLRMRVFPSMQIAVQTKLEATTSNFFNKYVFPQQKISIAEEQHRLANTIRYVEYIPEYTRYGGESVIRSAEFQFEASSAFILAQIDNSDNWNSHLAFILAIKMHIAFWTAQNFSFDQMKIICNRFIDEWLPSLYIPGNNAEQERARYLQLFFERAIPMKTSLVPAIREFITACSKVYFEEEALRKYYTQSIEVYRSYAHFPFDQYANICISFMHMTHNRLGIANGDEAWLVYLLQFALVNE